MLSSLPFTALDGQAPFRPDDLERFVREPRVGVLAYLRRNGRPNQVPIWHTYAGDGTLLMTTPSDAPKALALSERPAATLTIHDDRPPYRLVIIDGDVAVAPMPDDDPTTGVAERYLGRLGGAAFERTTAALRPKDGMALLRMTPTAVRGFDGRRNQSLQQRVYTAVRGRLPLPRSWF